MRRETTPRFDRSRSVRKQRLCCCCWERGRDILNPPPQLLVFKAKLFCFGTLRVRDSDSLVLPSSNLLSEATCVFASFFDAILQGEPLNTLKKKRKADSFSSEWEKLKASQWRLQIAETSVGVLLWKGNIHVGVGGSSKQWILKCTYSF